LKTQEDKRASYALELAECESGYTTKSNLYVEWNPYQNSHDILHRGRKTNPEVHIQAQMSLNSHSTAVQKPAML
jgi:hypothetical protein